MKDYQGKGLKLEFDGAFPQNDEFFKGGVCGAQPYKHLPRFLPLAGSKMPRGVYPMRDYSQEQ